MQMYWEGRGLTLGDVRYSEAPRPLRPQHLLGPELLCSWPPWASAHVPCFPGPGYSLHWPPLWRLQSQPAMAVAPGGPGHTVPRGALGHLAARRGVALTISHPVSPGASIVSLTLGQHGPPPETLAAVTPPTPQSLGTLSPSLPALHLFTESPGPSRPPHSTPHHRQGPPHAR